MNQLGQKFDGVAGGKKKNQWDKAPWEFFDYIVSYITNKDKKDLWKAGRALYNYSKNGNPQQQDNKLESFFVITPRIYPKQEEIDLIKQSIEEDDVLYGLVNVLVYGMRKYKKDNWKFVRPFRTRYFAALIRHLVAWYIEEKIDPEFGENHLHHAACCLYFLMWGEQHPKEI